MTIDCTREQDVLDAVAAGRWPERCDAELQEHIRLCRICQDVAVVSAALSEERNVAWESATVPPSSLVWWSAQIRAREEAARVAGRPIALAQGVALICLLAVAVVLVPLMLPWLRLAAAAASDMASWVMPRAAAVSSALTLSAGSALPLLAFVAAWALIAPIVLYFALSGE